MHEHLTKLTAGEKAAEIWQAMEDHEKATVRIGMFPLEIMRDAEAEGYNGRALAVSLMNCANADGGMRA